MVDLESIRKKLQTLQTQQTGNRNIWKPEPGVNKIRIVPYQHDKSNPFIEIYFHYNLGKKMMVSPFTVGESDPIVEFSDKLKETGSKDDWVLGKKMEPKLRAYAPIIVRGKEKEGVKFWGFGNEIYQELLSIMVDPDYGDITDLTSGRDIDVTYLTPKEAGNKYGKVSMRVKPKQSPATDDKEIATKILKEQPNLSEIYPINTYEELKKALNKWLNPEDTDETSDDDLGKARAAAVAAGMVKTAEEKDADDEDEEETPAPKVTKSANKPADTSSDKKVDDLLTNFEDIFKDK